MVSRLIQWDHDVPFTPLLYIFSWIGVIRVATTLNNPPDIPFDETLGNYYFVAWVVMGMVAPPVATVAWWLVRFKPGRPRLAGLWLQVVASIMQAAVIWTFAAASWLAHLNGDLALYVRNIILGVGVFTLLVLAWEIRTLVLLNRMADERVRSDPMDH